MLRTCNALAVTLAALAGRVHAQQDIDVPTTAPTATAPVDLDQAAPDLWSLSASAYAYFVPDDRNYVQPTIALDRDWFHFEARYNYEDIDTASIWVGYNLSFGEELMLDITPMIGAVFGNIDGFAPGYEFTLSWRGFELYSEGEYVFDTGDSSNDFFYTWTELTFSPTDWLRAGLVIQRTKARDSDFDIDRGLMVGVTYECLDFTAAVLNPDDSDPIVMLGLAVSIEF